MLKRLILGFAFLLAACATGGVTPPAGTTGGAVSAADPRAAQAGVEILRAGGSAADAASAVMLALTVVGPKSWGIGGGGFLVYHDEPHHALTTFDGREAAPMAATPAYFLGPDGRPRAHGDAVPGGLSIGVPGSLRLIEHAHERYGRLPWARLFDPAIRLARDGFAITPRLRQALSNPESLARTTAWGRAQFYDASGVPKPVGTILRNPELAATLEQVAAHGPEHFYHGPNAQALVNTARSSPRNPAVIATGDLASYDAKERPAVC